MRFIKCENLKPGHVLAENIMSENVVLLSKGYPLTHSNIARIREAGMTGAYVEDAVSAGININPIINIQVLNNARKQLKNLFSKTASRKEFSASIKHIDNAAASIVDECLTTLSNIINVVDLKTYDNYLYEHCTSVAVLSTMIGSSMGYGRSDLIELSKGAILHDIGKIFIDKEIISKPAALTAEEFATVQEHTRLGYEYLEGFHNISAVSRMISMLHHERMDGSGYPLHYTGEKLHPFAKIVSIADVYDALISDRPYKKALPPHKALGFINDNLGTMFDPQIAEHFFAKIAPYPLGSCVCLNDSTRWIVITQNEGALDRPILSKIENGMRTDVTMDLYYEDSDVYIEDVLSI